MLWGNSLNISAHEGGKCVCERLGLMQRLASIPMAKCHKQSGVNETEDTKI